MILSKDEAICLILSLSKNKEVSSPTKLNKLLARLNLFYIPVDIDFTLNKFGSFNADLSELRENDYYSTSQYEYKEKNVNKFILKPKGEVLIKEVVEQKLKRILTEEELKSLGENISYLSSLTATEISDNEHSILLVDVDDRFRLEQKINETFIELKDLYQGLNDIPENTIVEIRLKALIELCYYLIKYLKEMKFKRLQDKEYDFHSNMFDYYFLENIHSIIPFLKRAVLNNNNEGITINKYYQYFINSVRDRHPFSIYNESLNEIVLI